MKSIVVDVVKFGFFPHLPIYSCLDIYKGFKYKIFNVYYFGKFLRKLEETMTRQNFNTYLIHLGVKEENLEPQFFPSFDWNFEKCTEKLSWDVP